MGKYREILGVSSVANQDEIKTAFKNLAKKWHPDKFGSATPEERKNAEEKFKEISDAYDKLKDGIEDPEPSGQYRSNAGGPDPWEYMRRQTEDFIRQQQERMSMVHIVEVPMELLMKGGQHSIGLIVQRHDKNGNPGWKQVKVTLDITPDMKIGTQITKDDQPNVIFVIRPEAVYKTKDMELHTAASLIDIIHSEKIDVLDLVVGCKRKIKLPWGKELEYVIPSGFSGEYLKLNGLGFQDIHGRRGSLLIHMAPYIPSLTPEQTKHIESALKKIRQ